MFRQLPRYGIHQTWYVQSVGVDRGVHIDDSIPGIRIIASPVLTRWGLVGKLLSKAAYWTVDTMLLVMQLWRPVDIFMVRDKYWASLVGMLIARIKRRPFVIWMSYPFPDDDLERAPSFEGPMRWMLKVSGHFGSVVYYRIAMRRADHCFVQSERMKVEMNERFGIPLGRMTAVPMGVGNEFARSQTADLTPIRSTAGHPTVLYLGGLQVVRRLEILIDTFAQIAQRKPDVRFKIVGSGSVPEDRARLEERAREHGILDRIEFTGQLPFSEGMRHVLGADVCLSPIAVTPTLRVASPTKFVEYLALGRPCVGNDHPEQEMIATLSQGALVVPWDAGRFADATCWCLDNPDEARAMAERGRSWVFEHRTYDELGRDVAASLSQIESGSKSPPSDKAT